MLAHLKAKKRERNPDGVASAPAAAATAAAEDEDITPQEEEEATQMTCDVLCSLGASYASPGANGMDDYSPENSINGSFSEGKRKGGKSCPKQHQLPMFLSKTYHMIDRCEPTIATWSSLGDNFVVKNVEKFASDVLPLYFKHSNFSSFARQLNFYGFRKLRTDPILTSDVDPRTACYVRFYHERFQKDRPELLHQIKRATKSDQQSKDDVESLKVEVVKLRDCISHMSGEMDRKLAEISYEYNRRITNMSGEYDKLAGLVQEILSHHRQSPAAITAQLIHHPSAAAPQMIQPSAAQEATVASAVAAVEAVPASRVPDLMHSLSQVAAMSLQNQLRPPAVPTTSSVVGAAGAKRCAPDEADVPPAGRARTS